MKIKYSCKCGHIFWDYKSCFRKYCSLNCKQKFIIGGWKQSQETIKKRVLKLRGQKRTLRQRKRISKAHLGQVPWNKNIIGEKSHSWGRKWSIKARKRISERTKGKQNHFWKGGKTKLVKRIKQLSLYKIWRKDIFERDNYTCIWCNQQSRELNADHIKPLSIILDKNKVTTIRLAKNCKELWDINNGRTLCHQCHKKTDTYGIGRYRKSLNK